MRYTQLISEFHTWLSLDVTENSRLYRKAYLTFVAAIRMNLVRGM